MSGNAARKPRVLIADDERTSLTLLERGLNQAGYDVKVATSGPQVVSLLSTDPTIALVMLDWEMPGLSGLEVCRWLRAQVGSRLPLILLTAHADVRRAHEARLAGADAVMTKPFELARVLERVGAHIHRHGGGSSRPGAGTPRQGAGEPR